MRIFGTAAVCASAVAAGIIASSSGSASVTPAPFSTVRRERCFRVRNMSLASALLRDFHRLHAERIARDDARDDRREPVCPAPPHVGRRPEPAACRSTRARGRRAYIISFSVKARTNRSRPPNSASRSSDGPSTGRPFGRTVFASIGAFASPSRSPPAADRVVVLHRQADRIDHAVTLIARPASSDGSRAARAASSAARPSAATGPYRHRAGAASAACPSACP